MSDFYCQRYSCTHERSNTGFAGNHGDSRIVQRRPQAGNRRAAHPIGAFWQAIKNGPRRRSALRWLGIFSLIWSACCSCAAGQNVSQPAALDLAHKDLVFTKFFRQTNGWAAGDVATSVPLSDGRVLWLFGDSYVDQFDAKTGTLPCVFNARNAVLLQETQDDMHPQTLRNDQAGNRSFFHPPGAKPGSAWPCLWPGTGFQEADIIYIYLMEMQQTPQGGMWGFKVIGQYWAKMSFPKLKIIGYVKLPAFDGINFVCGFVKDQSSGFTYAFGDRQHFTGSDVFVARFPTRRPESAWSFWDGKGWGGNVTNAAPIAQATSSSVNVCRVRGKYLLITTAFSVACDQGRDIYASSSSRPTGPFSPRQTIFAVNDTVEGHYPFFYSAVAHPEFISDRDELLITYCINGYEPDVPTCVNGRMNPDFYRPRAIRFPLNQILEPKPKTNR